MPGSKATNPIMLARQGFVAWDPLKYENAAIFEENQRIRMFLELRELRSNEAIRGHYKVYKRHIWILTQNVLEPKKGMVDT